MMMNKHNLFAWANVVLLAASAFFSMPVSAACSSPSDYSPGPSSYTSYLTELSAGEVVIPGSPTAYSVTSIGTVWKTCGDITRGNATLQVTINSRILSQTTYQGKPAAVFDIGNANYGLVIIPELLATGNTESRERVPLNAAQQTIPIPLSGNNNVFGGLNVWTYLTGVYVSLRSGSPVDVPAGQFALSNTMKFTLPGQTTPFSSSKTTANTGMLKFLVPTCNWSQSTKSVDLGTWSIYALAAGTTKKPFVLKSTACQANGMELTLSGNAAVDPSMFATSVPGAGLEITSQDGTVLPPASIINARVNSEYTFNARLKQVGTYLPGITDAGTAQVKVLVNYY